MNGLSFIRRRCNLSQGQLAEKLGVTRQAINLWENRREPLPEATMISTVAAAADQNNVATATLIRTGCGCCGRVNVVNTGTSDVVVSAGSALFVKRVA